jgi:probable HAF family extracellular repeat protein
MYRPFIAIVTAATLCGCRDHARATQPATADGALDLSLAATRSAPPRYEVKLLSTLEGTSRGSGINNRSSVAGYSTIGVERHAALWTKDGITDLRTLGGPHSNVQWNGINNRGTVVGISQTNETEPLGQDWSCAIFLPTKGKICLGFYWADGRMHRLPTLGGYNGYAASLNDRGQIVGWAEKMVFDPTCRETQKLQFRAVMWEPGKSITRELRPFPGDSASAATAINQRGQVVGISGDCDIAVGRFSAKRAVMWDGDDAVEIPHLGGEAWHTPTAINERGHVVGFSNPPEVTGGALKPLAFLWTGGRRSVSLGVLKDDDNSQALGINARGQVVGVSCLGNACRAFLWDDGVMHDLKTLVDPSYPGVFLSARSINESGEITGNVLEQSSGKILAYIATPQKRND